jgi:flagellar biosynthesis protein FlhF
MRLRRFTGADPAAALRRVKEVLGPDAVILATRPGAAGGVEITAAVDLEPPGAEAAPAPEIADVTRELRALAARVAMLDRGLRATAPPDPGLGPEGRALVERLALQGVAPRLTAEIGREFEAARRQGTPAARALATSLERRLGRGADGEPRVRVFVGPTGSGKTTTIAKLAAAHAAAGARIGLVMADTYRIGAAEQLGTYARLLGAPMQTVRDGDELERALTAFADRDAVYVDTAGLGGDAAGPRDLRRLLAPAGDALAVTAVVSATASAEALHRAWQRLDPLGPRACVLTKLDEAPGQGAAWSWAAELGMALCWLGTGQRVPEDLTVASGDALARWLLAA